MERCQELAELLEEAPPGPITTQAACGLLQNPLFEDPEYEWCAPAIFTKCFHKV